LTIDCLCRGASIDAANFFNVREKVVNVILGGVHFVLIIGKSSRTLWRFYLNIDFTQLGKKSIFPQNPGSRPRYSYQKMFPWRAVGFPYNENKKFAPTHENLAKMGCKFLGCEAPRKAWGNIVGVARQLVRTLWRTKQSHHWTSGSNNLVTRAARKMTILKCWLLRPIWGVLICVLTAEAYRRPYSFLNLGISNILLNRSFAF